MVQAWSIGPERRPACSTVAGGVLFNGHLPEAIVPLVCRQGKKNRKSAMV